MKKLLSCLILSQVLVGFFLHDAAWAQAPQTIRLPKPQMGGGKPLMQALKERQSVREFRKDKLPDQVLSNLLWAANGINRPDSGRRTAPSAHNWQEIDVYLIIAEGVYIYEPKDHVLKLIKDGDLRALAGTQAYVQDAPANLIYVADTSRMGNATPQEKEILAAADTGFVSENVYLFCASEGLVTVVREGVDRPALSKAILLGPEQKIILGQTVGYPKN